MAAEKVRAVVLRSFRDKRTKKVHEQGSVIEVTRRRFEEIVATDPTLIKKEQ